MCVHSVCRIVSLGLLSSLLACSADATTKVCKTLLDPNLADAGQKPPMLNLTEGQLEKGTFERACLKSYSSGFPGGEKAFLNADSESLRRDLDHVEALFSQFATQGKFPKSVKDDPDEQRKLHIELGWDRQQVLLWGNFFYIRRLYEEADFERAIAEAVRVRGTFGLEIHPLTTWDKLEEATYFSKQALRNMIAIIEYRSQAKLSLDSSARTKLAEDFIPNRDALKPFFKTTGDPTADILRPYCQKNGSN
jgi:hypothetical protein